MKLFTKHPNSIGETYFEHFLFALFSGVSLVSGGVACIIHAVFPFLFENTGSLTAKKIIANVAKRQETQKITK